METALDWDDLRYFLAIFRKQTLTGAARVLSVSQPTMGRRLEALEQRLGTKLFRRGPSGYRPTNAARDLLSFAERMELEALAAARTVAGQDNGLAGDVRLTTTEGLALNVVAPLLARFRRLNPGIAVELLTHSRRLSLPRHEADLAIRLAAFEHQEVVQRRVATITFGVYAADRYLELRGRPDLTRGAEGHDLVVLNEEDERITDVRWMRSLAHAAVLAARTNSRAILARLCADGLGIACLPRYVGDALTGVTRLAAPGPTPERPVWLGVHRDARQLPRVRALYRYLGEQLALLVPKLAPASHPRKR